MTFLTRLFRRREPVTFATDDNMLRIAATMKTQTPQDALKLLDKPTCQRINLAEYRIKRALRAKQRERMRAAL